MKYFLKFIMIIEIKGKNKILNKLKKDLLIRSKYF